MAPGLGTSAAWDVPSPKGIGRIRAFSINVPSETETWDPLPLVEALTASLSSEKEKGSTG